MPIRWDVAAVQDCCDEADAELARAKPFLDKALPHILKAIRVLANVRQVENMPQYITQPLGYAEDGIKGDYERFCKSVPGQIQSIRDKVPAKEAARTRFKGKRLALFQVDPRQPKRSVAVAEVQKYKQWEREQTDGKPLTLPLERKRG